MYFRSGFEGFNKRYSH